MLTKQSIDFMNNKKIIAYGFYVYHQKTQAARSVQHFCRYDSWTFRKEIHVETQLAKWFEQEEDRCFAFKDNPHLFNTFCEEAQKENGKKAEIKKVLIIPFHRFHLSEFSIFFLNKDLTDKELYEIKYHLLDAFFHRFGESHRKIQQGNQHFLEYLKVFSNLYHKELTHQEILEHLCLEPDQMQPFQFNYAEIITEGKRISVGHGPDDKKPFFLQTILPFLRSYAIQSKLEQGYSCKISFAEDHLKQTELLTIQNYRIAEPQNPICHPFDVIVTPIYSFFQKKVIGFLCFGQPIYAFALSYSFVERFFLVPDFFAMIFDQKEALAHLQMNNAFLESEKEKLESLFQTALIFQNMKNLENGLKFITDTITATTVFSRAIFHVFDEGQTVLASGFSGISAQQIEEYQKQHPVTREEITQIINKGKQISHSFFIRNVLELASQTIESEKPQQDFVDWHPQDSFIVPLWGTQKEMIGFISLDDPKDGMIPTPEKVKILEVFANLAGAIIQKEKLVRHIKMSQEQAYELIESLPDLIFSLTRTGKFLSANKATYICLEISREALLQKDFVDFLEKGTEKEFLNFLNQSFSATNTHPNIELVLRSAKGRKVVLNFMARPMSYLIHDNENHVLNCIARDITDEILLQQKNIEDQKQKAVIKSMQELMVTMSHYINNSVASISGYGQMLAMKENLSNQFREKSMNVIKMETEKVIEVINSLKSVAKLDSKRYVGNVKMLDMDDILNEKFARITQKYAPAIQGNNHSLEDPNDQQ